MSKPIVKFLYGADPRESQSSQRTIQRFPGSFMEAQGENIPFGSVVIPPPFNTVPTIPTTEMSSRVSPQPMNRYKSVDYFPPLPRTNHITQSNAVMANREEVPESDIQPFSQKQSSGEPRRSSQMVSDQIVLKAPSYKFTPKRNGDLVTHSKREYKKNNSVDKPLNSDTVLRSKNPRNNEVKLRSSNPMLQVEMVNESDFLDQPKSQPAPVKSPHASKNSPATSAFTDQANFDGQIVLKAPKYKYTPKADGDMTYNRKKQYVKSQNTTQKYLYQGVKTHRENEFISCFGCSKPAVKTYQSQS